MKLAVLNGTEKKGVTHCLKEAFLEPFRENGADIEEFWFPRDCPGFCVGCLSCFYNGEGTCKDADDMQRIANALLEAELIVATSPVYALHPTGALKAMFDHFSYLWMLHRPAPEMFSKHAVVITQCLGAGARTAARDIRDNFAWWGVTDVRVFAARTTRGVRWEDIPQEKRTTLLDHMRRFSQRVLLDVSEPAATGPAVRLRFAVARAIHRNLLKQSCGEPELDTRHWMDLGWLDGERPWK